MRPLTSIFLSRGFFCAFFIAVFVLSAHAQTVTVPSRITQAIDEHSLVTLPGNVHPLARPEFDQGLVSDAQPLKRILLVLRRSADQEASLQKLLDDQQSRSSPYYHAWLTPEQFGQRFGASDADIQTVTQWLTAHGFSNINVGPGKSVMEFSGNVGQVRSAFHTEIHQYTVNGETHLANSSDPQIPAALAPVVVGPVALNNFPVKSYLHRMGTFRKSIKTGEVTPLLTFPAGPCLNNCYAVGPADFATIYNTQPLLSANPKIDGTGQTIAIVGESDINVQDVIDFRTMFGLPQNFTSSNIVQNGPDPGFNGSEGESDVDVEWAGAVAPGAAIELVNSGSTETTAGIFLSATYIVENNLAGVMSESFGGCEQRIGALNQFHNSLWQQAAAQGISVMVSAGDGGSAGCDNFDTEQTAALGLAVSGFASTPYNVAVGGTDFDDAGTQSTYWNTAVTSITPPVPSSALSYIPEIPWNDSCARNGLAGCSSGGPLDIVAGSGGVSGVYAKPVWQTGTGVPNDQHRDLPDISLFASIGSGSDSFYIMCQSDALPAPGTACNLTNFEFTFQGVGGTSVSSPAFAGIMALVNQKYGRQGNANYVLYALAKKSGASCNANGGTLPPSTCVFNDVTKGNNSVPCNGGSVNCSVSTAGSTGVLVSAGNRSIPAYTAGAGYDLATGLGSVNAQNLVGNWSSVSFSPSTTTLSATVNGKTVTSINGLTHGQAIAVTADVVASGGTGTPSGQVALLATPNPTANPGPSFGFDVLSLTSGAASNPSIVLPGGNYSLTAHYQGDSVFGASDSAAIPVSISAEPSKTLISIPVFSPNTGQETGNQPTSLVYGSLYIARVDVGNANAVLSYPFSGVCTPPACPSGKITWTDAVNGGQPVPLDGGTLVLNADGYSEDQSIQLTGGSHSLTASYGGDGSFQAGTGTYAVTVTPAPTTNSLFVATAFPTVGQPCNVTVNGAVQTATGAAPTGTVTFFDGSTQVGSPVPVTGSASHNGALPSFVANATLTLNNPGSRSLTAQYSGDVNYAPSTSAPYLVTLLIPTSISSFSVTPANVTYGTNSVLTATVTTNLKGPAMTGSLMFFGSVQGNAFGNVTQTNGTDANGNATIQATVTTVLQGSQTIYASYNGDPNYTSAISQMIAVQVNIPDFTLGPAAGISVVPVAGQTASGQVTITPVTQTPSTVTLLPLYPPTIFGYAITLTPAAVPLNGSMATATLTLTSTASVPTSSAYPARHAVFFSMEKTGWWALSLVAGLTALLLTLLGSRPGKHSMRLGLGLIGLLFFAIGCGSSGGSGSGGGGSAPMQTSITLTSTSPKVAQNQQFTLTATITSSSPATGTVAFYDYGNQIFAGNIPVFNGQVQAPTTGFTLGLGVHQLTAKYNGDSQNLTSTSTVLTQVVTGTTTFTIQGSTGADQHTLQATIGVQ